MTVIFPLLHPMNYYSIPDYNIIKHLGIKYPFVHAHKYTFEDIIEDYTESMGYHKDDVNMITFVKKQFKQTGEHDLEKILGKSTDDNIKKYLVYHKKQFSDIGMIKFAADFYGKNVEALANDVVKKMKLHIPDRIPTGGQLYTDLAHVCRCNLLVFLANVFFYYKIRIMLNDITEPSRYLSHIVAQIIEGKTFESTKESFYSFIVGSKKYKFQTEKIKDVIELLKPYVQFVNAASNDELLAYVQTEPDLRCIKNILDPKINIKAFLLGADISKAVAYPYMLSKKDLVDQPPELKLNLVNTNKYLIVEI